MDEDNLFSQVQQIMGEEGIVPQHIPTCRYADSSAPINELPCKCYELFWFLQGTNAVNAQCIAKIFKVTQEKSVVAGQYRVNKLGTNWSAWEQVGPITHDSSVEKGNS